MRPAEGLQRLAATSIGKQKAVVHA